MNRDKTVSKKNNSKILDFPELLQTDIWDCGASALQGVLLYYGIKVLTSDIIRLLRTNENDGTSLQSIKDTILTYGLKYNGQKMTTTMLKEYIDLKIPVILLLQAWAENKNPDYKQEWKSGHYVVLIGYADDKYIFEDPFSSTRVFLTETELVERWHDFDTEKEKLFNYGIAVFGLEPNFSSEQIIQMK